ncbi:hypothetical protein G6F46_014292 [Rhizopus delemar]|nr:hypothetical protein G6F46_014292 [Rhizopus delemar]
MKAQERQYVRAHGARQPQRGIHVHERQQQRRHRGRQARRHAGFGDDLVDTPGMRQGLQGRAEGGLRVVDRIGKPGQQTAAGGRGIQTPPWSAPPPAPGARPDRHAGAPAAGSGAPARCRASPAIAAAHRPRRPARRAATIGPAHRPRRPRHRPA